MARSRPKLKYLSSYCKQSGNSLAAHARCCSSTFQKKGNQKLSKSGLKLTKLAKSLTYQGFCQFVFLDLEVETDTKHIAYSFSKKKTTWGNMTNYKNNFCLFLDKLMQVLQKQILLDHRRPLDFVHQLGNAQLVARRAYLEIS